MAFYWVEYEGGDKGTIQASSIEHGWKVADRLSKGRKVLRVNSLPYPSLPALMDLGGHPEFCQKPNECKGKTSCPRQPSCVS